MDHTTQVDLAKQVFAHLDAGTTAHAASVTINPVTAYNCTERLAREMDLMRGEPLLMGLSGRIPNPGDYLTDDNTGIPVLMVRDRDGEVRAFINACRHRGTKLLDGAGQVRNRIVCPYHAWSYDLDGRLAVVPHSEGFEGFDIASCRLKELPVLERDGLIWVRPSGTEPIDADAHMGGLAGEFASYGFAGYHHYETRRIACAMNWKIIIDTFLEPYHFAVLHRDTVAPIFFPNLCLFDAYGRNLRETLPRRTIVDLKDQPAEDWDLIKHTAIVYVLFPNTVFVMQGDHAEVWRVFPLGNAPDQSVALLEFYTPEPVRDERARGHWQRNMDLVVQTVEREDFPAGEDAQQVYNSGALDSVVYGKNEPALAYFQRTIAAAVGEPIA